MKKRWVELWQRVGGSRKENAGDCAIVYAWILGHYREAHRAYHNLSHIKQCLGEFDKVKSLLREPDAVEMAIWFHDFHYDTDRKDNEERSAETAKEIMKAASLPDEFGKHVAELILATKHDIPPEDFDARILVDIDLASLGYSEKVFNRNTAKIRKEYKQVPKKTFAAERTKFLKSLLKRKTIYRTQFFFEKYEGKARQNLTRAVSKLSKKK